MDAVTLLETDHRSVDQAFRRYEEAAITDSPAAKAAPVERIVRELSVHAAIEEQILYPAVRRDLPGGAEMADEALQEHQEAKEVLRRIERMDPGDPYFDPSMRQLIQDVRHHVQEEEGEMFPKLRASLPSQQLRELGARMDEAKKTAPTRP
jgi:hemerythrin superfamily protein